MIINLHERFPQVNTLEAFSILDPSGLLGQPETASEYLPLLLTHYNDGPLALDTFECTKEYTQFSSFVHDHNVHVHDHNYHAEELYFSARFN